MHFYKSLKFIILKTPLVSMTMSSFINEFCLFNGKNSSPNRSLFSQTNLFEVPSTNFPSKTVISRLHGLPFYKITVPSG